MNLILNLQSIIMRRCENQKVFNEIIFYKVECLEEVFSLLKFTCIALIVSFLNGSLQLGNSEKNETTFKLQEILKIRSL